MKTTRSKRAFIAALFSVATMVASVVLMSRPAQAELLIRPNDRVVFYGDSITERHNYTRPVQNYIYTRYPDLKVRFFNAGWGGDTAGRAANRLERDVLSLNPTLVTICFGMNDGRYTRVNDEVVNNYRTNLDKIVTGLQARNVRVVIFSPPCVDYDRGDNRRPTLREVDYNKTLEDLANAASEVARAHNCTYYDILHPMITAQAALKAQTPGYTRTIRAAWSWRA